MGFQSIERGFFMDAPPISVQYSSTETCFKEKQSTDVFHENFSNEDCGIGSFQIISIFITFWSLTKISEGWLWINLVGFLSMEPFPLQCNRVKWFPLAFPSVKRFFFFFSSVLKAVSIDPTSLEITSTKSLRTKFNSIIFKSIQLISKDFLPIETFSTKFYSIKPITQETI